MAPSLLFLLCSLAPHARAESGLRSKGGELKKAEEVLAQLRRMEGLDGAPDGSRAYSAAGRQAYAELLSKVAALHGGDVKTDLLMAALLFEAAFSARRNADAPAQDCGRELRDAYRKLCLENRGARAEFLRAKARLHARWAEAVLRHLRGDRDAATLHALAEVRAARDFDAALAALAIRALNNLSAQVRALTPPEDSERGWMGGRVPFSQPSDAFAEMLDAVDSALASLARGRVYNLLRNARNSYRDGLYWLGKTLQRRSLVVSIESFDSTSELRQMRLDALNVDSTVLANWRSAERFTRKAEQVSKGFFK
jgi:hypothetical protein